MDKQTNTNGQSKDRDLDKARVEAQPELTTDQGIRVSDDRNSLRAGERGPTLLEDFALREKIFHFDHERIPERVVHARGAGAHGFFQVYQPLAQYTKAEFLNDPSLKTPVFVRFSTVAGSRGSADTARDVRGFAVKFYTEQGNFDMVGNNMPVFFIQDAIKFPDLIHAAKAEPNNEIPQASTAHDTFWDFISLTPESMHMIMWVMSDRALPRSFRMMEGFGVHTFRLVNAQGESHFVKFHWKPILGVHSLIWDESQKLTGKDPDFHRRDLWEAIEQDQPVEYELGLQIIKDGEESRFDFDILDATKLWPEDLVPVQRVGKLTLDRNPDNYFAETEQVAFHTGNVVPGIDFSDDPLLQGRLFSYLDTQLSRLGSPNFAELPINRPVAPVSNNQRDGHMRYPVNKGRVSYEPNSLADNKPFEVGADKGGYASYPEKLGGAKVRVRSESFGDHYGQAKLFWNSMSPVEQKHIISALQFELGKVETKEIRLRMLGHLEKISDVLASHVAVALGESRLSKTVDATAMPQAKLVATTASGGLQRTSGLSMTETPKDSIKSRQVAVLVADGVAVAQVEALKAALEAEGAKALIVAPHLGTVEGSDGKSLTVDKGLATVASVLFDAVFVPGGPQSVNSLIALALPADFVKEAYKHGKVVGAAGEGLDLLKMANITGKALEDGLQNGVVAAQNPTDLKGTVGQFVTAMKQGRFLMRLPYQETPS